MLILHKWHHWFCTRFVAIFLDHAVLNSLSEKIFLRLSDNTSEISTDMANEAEPSHSHRRKVDNLDFVDQVEDVHIDANDELPTPVQGDTRTVKDMFDTFMPNFAQMSKILSSVQKEFSDLKSDRSRVKSPAPSKKCGRDKSGSPSPRKKHILSKTYEQRDYDSDVNYSDKSDVDEALNTLIEGDACN